MTSARKAASLMTVVALAAVPVLPGRVRAAVTLQLLPAPTSYTVATAVSNGGTHVTGYANGSGVPQFGALWINGAGPINIAGSSGLTNAIGECISADGSVIVGRYGSGRVYRWSSAGGMIALQEPQGASSAFISALS